jgi:hypothetical protein
MLIIGCDYHPAFQQIAFVDTETGRHPRGLPVLVYEVSRRVWGLRLRRTEQGLALSPPFMLPSVHYKDVGVRIASFRS